MLKKEKNMLYAFGGAFRPTMIFITLLIAVFLCQLLICNKVKGYILPKLPVIIFIGLGAAFYALGTAADGWGAVAYGLYGVFSFIFALDCGIAWAVYGIMSFIGKRKNKKEEKEK